MDVSTQKRRAVIYTRLSDARNGDSIEDQQARCRKRAAELGWEVTRVVTENDISAGNGKRTHASAFKRRVVTLPGGRRELRVVRPAWRQVLDDLASGAANSLVALDLDRVARDPRDLEDLIDTVESAVPRIPVESVTGSLKLASDADITMARVLVAVANKSSRDTARRVAASRERRAQAGTYGGGRRPFGYEADGVTVRESEAAEVRRWADQIIGGTSLASIVRDLREREVPSVTGAPWSTRTVSDIVRRARNAGLASYQGTVTAQAAWPAILEDSTWRAACAVLSDPGRRTSPGNQPRWLGSLIYRCGVCDDGTTVSVSGGRVQNPSYCCHARNSHLRRSAGPLDALVRELVTGRLARADAVHLLNSGPEVDTAGLAREAAGLRERKGALARLFASGDMDDEQFREASRVVREKLEQAEVQIAKAADASPVAALAGREDAGAIWERMELGQRRAVVRTLLDITLLPARRGRQPGGAYFDRQSVRIDWKGAQS